MTKKIIILGYGGNCNDILDTIIDINDINKENYYKCIGFLDDDSDKLNRSFLGVKVLGPLSMAKEFKDCNFVFGIGSVSNYWRRQDILNKTEIPESRFETIIHPTASISRTAQIGIGSVIFQNVTITTNAKIGKFVYVLPNSVISHDDIIANYTIIAGGVCISGNVKIGESCYIGTNSAVRENIVIGNYSLIGMASNVIKNVADNNVVVGNPAEILKK